MSKNIFSLLNILIKYSLALLMAIFLIYSGLNMAYSSLVSSYGYEFKCDRNLGYCEFIDFDLFKNIVSNRRFYIEDVTGVNEWIGTCYGKSNHPIPNCHRYYIKTSSKDIEVSTTNYNVFKRFYEENQDKLYIYYSNPPYNVIFDLFLTLIGLIIFIPTCRNIIGDYIEKIVSDHHRTD